MVSRFLLVPERADNDNDKFCLGQIFFKVFLNIIYNISKNIMIGKSKIHGI